MANPQNVDYSKYSNKEIVELLKRTRLERSPDPELVREARRRPPWVIADYFRWVENHLKPNGEKGA